MKQKFSYSTANDKQFVFAADEKEASGILKNSCGVLDFKPERLQKVAFAIAE